MIRCALWFGLVVSALSNVTLFASPNRAGIFDQADQLFALREGSANNIAAANAEYQRLLPSLSESDLGYAVQQIGKIAVYEGTYFIPDTTANQPRKAQIFDSCRKTADKLKNIASQKTVYTFWRLTCSALWIRYATVRDRLLGTLEVKREFDLLIDEQLDVKPESGVDLRYQGGGVNRVLAGIYADSLSAIIRSGLPNAAKSLEMAERALLARGYPGDINQGTDYYSNYRQSAIALIALQRNADARQVLDSAISEIQDRITENDLPVGMIPETNGELVLLQNLHTRLIVD